MKLNGIVLKLKYIFFVKLVFVILIENCMHCGQLVIEETNPTEGCLRCTHIHTLTRTHVQTQIFCTCTYLVTSYTHIKDIILSNK